MLVFEENTERIWRLNESQEALHVGCEALEEFPIELSKLSTLEELDFSRCRSLKEIPEGFGGMTNLCELKVGAHMCF